MTRGADVATRKEAAPVHRAAGSTDGPRAFVHEHITAQALRTPDAPAVIDGETLTYAELERRANRLAHHLQRAGAGPERIVGLFLPRSADLVVSMLAVLKAGAAFLPLDPDYPAPWLRYMLEDSAAPILVARADEVARLPRNGAKVVHVDHDDGGHGGAHERAPVTVLRAGNPAYVFYTSGSSGRPKGVVWPHARVVERDPVMQGVYAFTANDRHLLKSATGFTLLVREVLWPLRSGARVFVVPVNDPQDPRGLAEWIFDKQITIVSLVPSMLVRLLDEPVFADARSLRHVVCFGEALGADLRRRFIASHHARLTVFYGATEAPSATFVEHQPGDEREGVLVGAPLPQREVYLLDNELHPVAPGGEGEICVAGSLSRGYLNRPGLTAERFVPHPFSEYPGERLYRTGDRGRWHADGTLEFRGRTDEQANLRGVRVELAEVDSAMSAHPRVAEAAAAVRAAPSGEQVLVGYVVAGDAAAPTAAALRRFLGARLPKHMVPTVFQTLDALPRTPSGKLDRRALPAPVTQPSRSAVPDDVAATQIGAVWRDLLGGATPDVDVDFFAAGGHSLLSVTLLAEVERVTGVRVELAGFLRAPTMGALLEQVRRGRPAEANSLLVPIRRRGLRAPLFFVPGGGGGEAELAYIYAALASGLDREQPVYGLRAPDRRGSGLDSVERIASAFTANIRSVQPRGPYYIAGDCIGGVLAFETARQLVAAGERVAVLALLDSPMPNRRIERRARAQAWRRVSALYARGGSDWLRRAGRFCATLARTAPWHWPARLSRAAGAARSVLRVQRAVVEVKRRRGAHQRTMFSYRPHPYTGRITLLLTDSAAAENVSAAWAELASGGVDVHRLPGDHRSYMREHADVTAACLQRCLETNAIPGGDTSRRTVCGVPQGD